jgi:hypothetical protein
MFKVERTFLASLKASVIDVSESFVSEAVIIMSVLF